MGEHKEWRHGFCDCCGEIPLALCTCLCPCYTFGTTVERLEGQHKWVCCCVYFLCMELGCWSCLGCHYRGKVRDHREVGGSAIGDFCAHLCCPCCALIQENREMEVKHEMLPGEKHYGTETVITKEPE